MKKLLICLSLITVSGIYSAADWQDFQKAAEQESLNDRLFNAAGHGNLEDAQHALEEGADINALHPWNGLSPLMLAAANPNTIEILDFLIAQDANLDTRDSKAGKTALFIAAYHGNIPALEKLLAAGADPALKNNVGQTATEFAKENSKIDPETKQIVAQMLSSTMVKSAGKR